ncbi:ABC transporter permease [Paenibacillus oryzae]|uniref:ABC transporter permease n=1 Tax=Paenibacillus oryzae TaxID=1844972 RepID=A0A1A5YMW8_9BACL|nr:ABC transporter permease [Paenibacillus oryzae]OBR66893.1 ABC transporter permease [Paenibacillus oryzae]
MDFYSYLIIASISSGTPLLFAVLGGILSERSGVIFLGTEGTMLIGAVVSCLTFAGTGSMLLSVLASLAAAGGIGLAHAFLCVTLRANQIVSGLALTLFGTGLSAYLGKPVAGAALAVTVPRLSMPWLEKIPFAGAIFSNLDVFIWISFGLVAVLYLYIYKTSWGLHLRAIGDSPATSDAMGLRVGLTRYLHVIGGAMLMGLAGCYLIMVYSPNWMEGMTSGRGWIAIALIILAAWNPLYALGGAYLFGGLDALGFRLQLMEIGIPSYFLKMLPYLVTIVVLMIVGWRGRHVPSPEPKSLGSAYVREQRS